MTLYCRAVVLMPHVSLLSQTQVDQYEKSKKGKGKGKTSSGPRDVQDPSLL